MNYNWHGSFWLKKFASNKIWFFINLKILEMLYKIREFLFLFFKKKMLANEIEDDWSLQIFHIGGFAIP